jgi:hypothetical protein
VVVANLREHHAAVDGPITADEQTATVLPRQELERVRVQRPEC